MYSEAQQSSHFQTTNKDCKRLVAELISKLEPQKSNLIIPALQPLDTHDSLYLLREGTVSYLREGKVLFHLDDGDMIGLEERDSLAEAQISSKFAVRVDQFDRQKFEQTVLANSHLQQLWSSFLAKQLALYVSIISSLFKNVIESQPRIKHYQANETILEQGCLTNDVYTIVQGQAQVFKDTKNIGTIATEQVFGSYAALSGTTANASVISSTRSLVLSIDRLEFIEMLRNKKLEHLAIFNNDNHPVVL